MTPLPEDMQQLLRSGLADLEQKHHRAQVAVEVNEEWAKHWLAKAKELSC